MKIIVKITMTILLLLGLSLPLASRTYAFDSDQDLIKKLDGAKYIGHSDTEMYKQDEELVIHSTTLVWRNRVTWATPEVTQLMKTGQNGFKKRQIGEWIEYTQIPIVGRIASKTVTLYNDTVDTLTFTISEDGNTIAYQGFGINITYYKSSAPVVNPAPVVNTPQLAFAYVESRGEFYVLTKDGRKVSGEEAKNIPLEEGTKVVTGKDGHVKMTLPDNTTFTVGPNSDLAIDKFVYDPDKSPEKIMATMTKGVFRWVTGNKAVYKEPGQMKVNLPVVAVGIRGTDFEATVEPNGIGSVVLNFGQLEITEKKTGFTFLMNAGEKITFGADGSVSRPVKI